MPNPKQQVTTPKGQLSWVTISGAGSLSYDETYREYKASVELPIDCKFVSDAEQFYSECTSSEHTCQTMGYSLKDEDNSKVIFTFKTRAKYPDGSSVTVKVYNAKVKPVELGETLIGNGTIGALHGTMAYYRQGKKDGLTFYLRSVQIIELVEYGGTPDFEESEGFEGETNPFEVSSEKPKVEL